MVRFGKCVRPGLGRVHWKRGLVRLVVCNAVFVGLFAAAGFYYFYFDRNDLPDLDGFIRSGLRPSDTSTMPTASH